MCAGRTESGNCHGDQPNDGLMDTRMDKGWPTGKTFKKEGVPLDRLPPKFKVCLVESNS